jgi:hypothetical protein
LSVAMGNLAIKEYNPRYRLFFNTSCTRSSLPGYQKMGFSPLSPKVYLTRYSLLSLIKYILASRKSFPLQQRSNSANLIISWFQTNQGPKLCPRLWLHITKRVA